MAVPIQPSGAPIVLVPLVEFVAAVLVATLANDMDDGEKIGTGKRFSPDAVPAVDVVRFGVCPPADPSIDQVRHQR